MTQAEEVESERVQFDSRRAPQFAQRFLEEDVPDAVRSVTIEVEHGGVEEAETEEATVYNLEGFDVNDYNGHTPTKGQMEVLILLANEFEDPVPVATINDHLDWNYSASSALLRLWEEGLVARNRQAKDGTGQETFHHVLTPDAINLL